jgi:hypothetical protein
VQSGAFWFYRKLGFRPVDPKAAALVEREESRMRRTPDYRSSRRTLEKLAQSYILFEGPSAEPGAWDNFHIRTLALAFQKGGRAEWPHFAKEEKLALDRISQAKESGSEARYLRLMQRHPKLRAAMLRLGSKVRAGH